MSKINAIVLIFSVLLILAMAFFCHTKKCSMKQTIALISTSIMFSAVLFVLANVINSPKIELVGESDVTLEVCSDFIEPGYHAHISDEDLTDSVTVSGNVDINKVGEYKLEYSVKYLYGRDTKQRKIHVVDSTPPVIELYMDENPQPIYDEGDISDGKFIATDNYDGELTDKVTVTRLRNGDTITLSYSVEDSSGNIAIETKTVEIEQLSTPEIKLKGYSSITLALGDKYNERGATAVDSTGTDITDKIKISGKVDSDELGTYTILYTVKDRQKHEATAMRVIYVVSKEYAMKNVVYLTFDDGPSREVTPRILDILKENDVNATFFIINYSDADREIIKRMYNEGNSIGIHGYSHRYRDIYASENAFVQNVEKLNDRLEKTTGNRTNIMRFPGGSSNTVSSFNPGIMTKLTQTMLKRGYKYFDWNVASGDADAKKMSKETIVKNVTGSLKKGRGNVVLMHDSKEKSTTADALPEIIRYCKEQGYYIAPITDGTVPVTHNVYN